MRYNKSTKSNLLWSGGIILLAESNITDIL